MEAPKKNKNLGFKHKRIASDDGGSQFTGYNSDTVDKQSFNSGRQSGRQGTKLDARNVKADHWKIMQEDIKVIKTFIEE